MCILLINWKTVKIFAESGLVPGGFHCIYGSDTQFLAYLCCYVFCWFLVELCTIKTTEGCTTTVYEVLLFWSQEVQKLHMPGYLNVTQQTLNFMSHRVNNRAYGTYFKQQQQQN